MIKQADNIKRIVFDCERMKYPHTGLYHFCLQLGLALQRQHDKTKEEITYYAPLEAAKLFGEENSFVQQKSLHKFLSPSLRTFDLWHCTYQASHYLPPGSRIKKVFTIHDLNFLYEHTSRPDKINRSLKDIQKKVDISDVICTISAYVKKDIEQHINTGNKPIHVIYNGCNISIFSPTHPPAILPEKPFLFTIGTVLKKKNFHVLPALLRNNDLHIVISGILQDEEYLTKIKEEAVKHGVTNRVIFTGPVSDNDKAWYFQHCEAFLFPSLAEGFGLPVIEAMAFGKPVFLSTATSLPEIGGDLAYYFHSFDAEDMKLTLNKGLEHYRNNNPADAIRARASLFNWDDTARKYLSVYRSLLNR